MFLEAVAGGLGLYVERRGFGDGDARRRGVAMVALARLGAGARFA